MSKLFSPISLRGVTTRNRIFVSPMCMYSATEGVPNEWHYVHLASRAVGGAGLVMVEATAISPEGRISPFDTGIWNEEQVAAWRKITSFIKEHGSVPAIQIAHAGRKASTDAPWNGGKYVGKDKGGWDVIAPSAIAFDEHSPTPKAMDEADFTQVKNDFVESAKRALKAGFEVIELHCAHGYLLHEFLSPLSNQRTDQYGGSFENRVRFPLEVYDAVRAALPETTPIFVRVSATDWVEGGWDIEQSIKFSALLQERGVDLIDCSSGGNVPKATIPVAPGYQVPFSERIKHEAKTATGAVGVITSAQQAETILVSEQADVIFLARELLRDPYWPLHAARFLNIEVDYWPKQYGRVG